MVVSREKKTALIHTASSHIIQTADIRKMENLLNQQIFFHTDNRAIIKAKFNLSAQYDLSNLFPIYRDSLLDELKEDSIINYHILANGKVTIEDMDMNIKVKDNYIIKEKVIFIKNFLQVIFKERFDYDINVNFEFIKAKERKKQSKSTYSRNIGKPVNAKLKEKEEKASEAQANVNNKKPATNITNTRKSYGKSPRDPSLVFGRNFDGRLYQ